MDPFDWEGEMDASGEETEAAKHFWHPDMFDQRETWQVSARPALRSCVVCSALTPNVSPDVVCAGWRVLHGQGPARQHHDEEDASLPRGLYVQ